MRFELSASQCIKLKALREERWRGIMLNDGYGSYPPLINKEMSVLWLSRDLKSDNLSFFFFFFFFLCRKAVHTFQTVANLNFLIAGYFFV